MTNTTSPLAVTPQNLPQIMFANQPVVTTKILATVYGAEKHHIKQNFANHRERFTEGKHFFQIEGQELRELKNGVDGIYLAKTVNKLTLWTERGAVRHAKILDTDKAWDIFELLEDNYFDRYRINPQATEPQQALPSPYITPEQQNALQQIVARKTNKDGSIRAYFWSRFNNHFKLGSYKQLPAAKFDEAVKYLKKIPAKTTPKRQVQALPQPENWLLPREQQRLIEERLNRVMGIFHPFSDQFLDLLGVYRLLRGRGAGGEENREMRQVLIQPNFNPVQG